MDRILYTAANGANQLMRTQGLVANNLANVNTTGFKSDFAVMHDYAITGDGYTSRVLPISEGKSSALTQGPIINTSRSLDIAVKKTGFIAVENQTGQEGYTRRGDLQVSPEGVLTTGDGKAVLGSNGTIVLPPVATVNIRSDGAVLVKTLNQSNAKESVVDKIKFVKPEKNTLYKGEDGLFYTKNNQPLAADDSIQVSSNAMEGSNVNAIEAMVSMIDLSRSFEMDLKVMQETQENDAQAAQIMMQ